MPMTPRCRRAIVASLATAAFSWTCPTAMAADKTATPTKKRPRATAKPREPTSGKHSATTLPRTSDATRMRIAQVSPTSTGSSARWALVSWAQEIRLRTSIEISQEPATVSLASSNLFRYPLLYWAGDSGFERLADGAVTRLRQHLSTGGMLVIDDTGRSGPSADFDRSVRRMLRRTLGKPLRRVSANHVLYRSFYRLRAPVGRRHSFRYAEGIQIGRRFAVLYLRNDLLGAFARSPAGGPALRVVPGGEAQREQAYRLGINVAMYALCLDYKDDHAHVQALLHGRRGAPQARRLEPQSPPAPATRRKP